MLSDKFVLHLLIIILLLACHVTIRNNMKRKTFMKRKTSTKREMLMKRKTQRLLQQSMLDIHVLYFPN